MVADMMKDYSYDNRTIDDFFVSSDRLVKGLSEVDKLISLVKSLPIVDEDTADFKIDLLDYLDGYKRQLLGECYSRGLVKLSSGEE